MVSLFCGLFWVQNTNAAPVASALEQARADRVASMPDESPADRINQLLAARDFSDAEMFVLAATHPGIVEHLIDDDLRLATDYLFAMGGAELHRLRNSGTLIRSPRSLTKKEKQTIAALSAHFGQDNELLRGIRLGPKDGRFYILQLTYQIKKKKTATFEMEMVWPSAPSRDEESRTILTKHFNARPSRSGSGTGSLLPVQDASFEDPYSLADGWRLSQGRVLGAPTPIQEVMQDPAVAIDGTGSVRFFATERTRVFQNVVQEVRVVPGQRIRLRVQHKAENVRVEYQQRRSDYKVQATFLNGGYPVGAPLIAKGRIDSHPWELLEIEATTPPNANEIQIELSCSLSGTAWFDAVVLEVVDQKGQWQ
ncbi:MAG: hypothetical protein ACPGTU_11525 [Myxococcota bacterium]